MSGRSTRKDFNICDVYFWLSYGVIRILHIIGREATKEYVRYKDYSSYSGYYYNYKYEYNYGKTIGSQIAIGLSVIFMLYLAYRLFIVTIRRVHDLGISGKRFVIVNLLSNLLWFAESAPPFAVIGAIALIGWGIPLYWKIIFFRGEQKGNKYGVDPLKYIPEIKILTTKELLFGNTFAKVNRISKDEFALSYTVRLLPFICVYLLIHNCFSFIFSIIPLQYFDFRIYSLLYFPLLYPLFYFVLCVDIEFRRIQDFGKSGWWLLFIIPILLIINFILFRLFNLIYSYLSCFDIFSTLFRFFGNLEIFLVPYIFLLFPESKEPNQYGSPRGKLNIDPNDKFLVFIVKILRKCHLVSHE